jgi:hypothetical protein
VDVLPVDQALHARGRASRLALWQRLRDELDLGIEERKRRGRIAAAMPASARVDPTDGSLLASDIPTSTARRGLAGWTGPPNVPPAPSTDVIAVGRAETGHRSAGSVDRSRAIWDSPSG